MSPLFKLLFRIFVFLLPTQLAIHFWPEWALVFGIRVDYLSPTIYLTDVLLLLVLGIFSFSLKTKTRLGRNNFLLGLGLLLFVFANVLLATSFYAALFKWLRIIELTALSFLVVRTKGLNFTRDFLKPLLLSAAAFSLIGIAQLLKGGTLGGLFYFLGERSFDAQTPGISLINLFGSEHLLPYSTFPHPNSLAGFLAVVFILYFFQKRPVFSKTIDASAVLITGTALLLTFSFSAWLSLVVTLFVFWLLKWRKLLFAKVLKAGVVFLVLFSLFVGAWNLKTQNLTENLSKRIELARASLEMVKTDPLFGAGANNFVINLPKFSKNPNTAWFLQPVHNIYLLVLAETGILGLALFLVGLNKIIDRFVWQNNLGLALSFLFILLVGTMDHYFLTLQQNLLLFSLVLGYSLRR